MPRYMRQRFIFGTFLGLACAILGPPEQARLAAESENAVPVKVVGIVDGDTITVVNEKTLLKVRLHGIDCPERGQASLQKRTS